MSMGGSLRGRQRGGALPGAPSSVHRDWLPPTYRSSVAASSTMAPSFDLEEEDALRLDVAVLLEDDLLGDGVRDLREALDVVEERLAVGVPLEDAVEEDVGGVVAPRWSTCPARCR